MTALRPSPIGAPIGLSAGATALAAVTPTRVLSRPAVAVRCGVPIAGFVDRVGDPVGIVAADGGCHPAATLLAEALADLTRATDPGRPAAVPGAIAHPSHWRPGAVAALRRATERIEGWQQVALIADHDAALAAVRGDAALPGRGVLVVCDAGGSGTTVTPVDAACGAVLAPPLRYRDFGGDAIDAAVLRHVLEQAGPGPAGTSALGPLTRLRAECRAAKERLSALTATALPVGIGSVRGEMRLTRAEVGELIREPLAGLLDAVTELLAHNGIRSGDVTAVVCVGGTAAVPALTAALSGRLRAPVVVPAAPALAAAAGAGLLAAAPPSAPPTVVTAAPAPQEPPLAWSRAVDVPELAGDEPAARSPRRAARPRLEFTASAAASDAAARAASVPAPAAGWHRRPLLVAGAVLLVVAGSAAAAALALRSDSAAAPGTPSPSISTAGTPPTGGPAPRTVVAVPAPAVPAPAPASLGAPPPVPETVVAQSPSVTETAPMTVGSTPSPVTETATPAPAPPPAPVTPAIPSIPPIPLPAIPGLTDWLPQPPG